MSTPASMIATAGVTDPEFGRIAERSFFSVPIDWPKSIANEAVPMTYVENFLTAIKGNSSLPVLVTNSDLVQRDGLTVMHGGGGVDWSWNRGELW